MLLACRTLQFRFPSSFPCLGSGKGKATYAICINGFSLVSGETTPSMAPCKKMHKDNRDKLNTLACQKKDPRKAWLPLASLSTRGDTPEVRILVSFGADPMAKDLNGRLLASGGVFRARSASLGTADPHGALPLAMQIPCFHLLSFRQFAMCEANLGGSWPIRQSCNMTNTHPHLLIMRFPRKKRNLTRWGTPLNAS